MTNSIFFGNNTAEMAFGGAIFSWTDISLNLTEVSFLINTALINGGAINTQDNCTVLLNKCYFAGNRALRGVTPRNQGNISGNRGKTNLHKGKAGPAGGAVFCQNPFWVEISNCLFDGSVSGAVAGAGSYDVVINILNTKFYNNSGNFGGAILMEQIELNLSNVFLLKIPDGTAEVLFRLITK